MPVSDRLIKITSWRVGTSGRSTSSLLRNWDDHGPVAITAVSVSYLSDSVVTAATLPPEISTPVAGDSRTTLAPNSLALDTVREPGARWVAVARLVLPRELLVLTEVKRRGKLSRL